MDKERKLHLVRESLISYRKYISWENQKIGYDYYTKGLLHKYLSGFLFKNPMLNYFIKLIDSMVIKMIESVKQIKRTFHYAVDKDNRYLN
jgi:hypothetical protein